MKRRDLERRLRMAGCCAQTQRNQGTPGPEDPRQPRRELSLRPTATVVELVASRRVLGGISTTPPAAPGCCCTATGKPAITCASIETRTAAPAPPPNPSCASAFRATKAMRASESCSSTSGDPLAAGAADPGGVAARLLLGIKMALAV
jgi:hypothetical protein